MIALPVPQFKNVNLRRKSIEVFYTMQDTYNIIVDDIEYREKPAFGWLSDDGLTYSAYVDVIMSIQHSGRTENLTKRIYLASSVLSSRALEEQALRNRGSDSIDVLYKATIEPFEYIRDFAPNIGDIPSLLEEASNVNMSVTLRSGVDRGVFERMTGNELTGQITTHEKTKDIVTYNRIRNYDIRGEDVDKTITDEFQLDDILAVLKNSRVFDHKPTIKSVHSDNIYDKKRSFASFFSPLFLSEDATGQARGLFFFDEAKFIEHFKDGVPSLGREKLAFVSQVKVTRKRVKKIESNNDFAKDSMFQKFDETTPEQVVMLHEYSNGAGSPGSKNISTASGTKKSYCFVDKDAMLRKLGTYCYEAEVTVTDRSAVYFAERLQSTRDVISAYDEYISFARTVSNSVDPVTGLFSDEFSSRAAEAYSSVPNNQKPWSAAAGYIGETLQKDGGYTGERADLISDKVISIVRVCNPDTGTERGLEIVRSLLQQVASFYEEKLKVYGLNLGGTFDGQVGKRAPSSGTGDYENATKFSYTFNEHLDKGASKNMRSFHFSQVQENTDGLLEINSRQYRTRMQHEKERVLGKGKSFPSNVSVAGKDILSNINTSANATVFAHITPHAFRIGEKNYMTQDFIAPPDNERDEEVSDMRAQIYLDSSSPNNEVLVQEFMRNNGVSITSLAEPSVQTIKMPVVGTGLRSAGVSKLKSIDSDNSSGAMTSRKTMKNFLNALIDAENSKVMLRNPILDVSIRADASSLTAKNFKGKNVQVTQQLFNSLPMHIKATLLYLSSATTDFTLNSDSYIQIMASNFDSNVNDSYDARFFYELYYKQIQKVQFLSGFQKNVDGKDEYQAPIFRDFVPSNLVGLKNGKLLCRLVPYESNVMDYDAHEGINGVPVERHFILNYKASSFENALFQQRGRFS